MFRVRGVRGGFAVLAIAASVLAGFASSAKGAGARATSAVQSTVHGVVRAGGDDVRGATVRLVRAGARQGVAEVLATATSDRHGRFELGLPLTVPRTDVLYVTAQGGSISGHGLPSDVELATALAELRTGPMVVNELTTVASGYSLAQFAAGGADTSNEHARQKPLVDPPPRAG